MEIKVNHVQVGNYSGPCTYVRDMSVNKASITTRTIGLAVWKMEDSETVVKILVLKKDIMKVKVSLQTVNPFISLMLKHSAADRVAMKMGMDRQEEWVYNTRGKEDANGWISVFFIMTKDFPAFFLEHFHVEILSPKEAFDFLNSKGMLKQAFIHRVGYVGKFHEFIKETGPGGAAVFDMDMLLYARKLTTYISLVDDEKVPLTGKIKFLDPTIVSRWFLDVMYDERLASLVCGACGKESIQKKCSRCESVRYCSETCVNVDHGEHRKVCGGLADNRAAEEKKVDERAEFVLKQFDVSNIRLTYSQFDRLWQKMINPLIKKDRKARMLADDASPH